MAHKTQNLDFAVVLKQKIHRFTDIQVSIEQFKTKDEPEILIPELAPLKLLRLNALCCISVA